MSRISQSECSSSGEHFPLQAEHSLYYLSPPGHYPGRALEKMRKLRPGPHVFLVTASRILWLSHEQDSKAGWPALGGQWPHAQRRPAAIRIGAEPMLTFFLSFPTPSSKNQPLCKHWQISLMSSPETSVVATAHVWRSEDDRSAKAPLPPRGSELKSLGSEQARTQPAILLGQD